MPNNIEVNTMLWIKEIVSRMNTMNKQKLKEDLKEKEKDTFVLGRQA